MEPAEPPPGRAASRITLVGRGNSGTLGLKHFMKDPGVGISVGLCFGAALGAAMQNVAVGVAIGTSVGMVFSAPSPALACKKVASDKPPPHPLDLY